MDDNKFFITIWSVIGVVAVCVTCAITIVSVNTDIKMAEAITKGTSPLDTACAFRSYPWCQIRAAERFQP